MKATAKSILLLMVMAVLLVALTGCGENKKLVATKDNCEDSYFGKYKDTVEITFKNKKADSIVVTKELESQEIVDDFNKYIAYLNTDEGMQFKVEGKKVIITFNPEVFVKNQGFKNEDLTRDALKESLENAGYNVK